MLLLMTCWPARVATAFTACNARSGSSGSSALSAPSIRPRGSLVELGELGVSPFTEDDVSASTGHRTNGFAAAKNRRTFLGSAFLALAGPTPALADQMLLTDKDAVDVPPFKGGVEEAKERFVLAMSEIDSLLANYDEITKGGNGDNVRLYLGTQVRCVLDIWET